MMKVKRYRATRKYQEDIFGLVAHKPNTPSKVGCFLLQLYFERTKRIQLNYNIFRVDLRSPKKLDKRQSFFMKKLILRNRARCYYKMNDRALKTFLQYPRMRRGHFETNFVNHFEGRLDFMLMKHYFLEAMPQIRNALIEGVIMVNDFIIPRHRHFGIKQGDVVSFADRSVEPSMRKKIISRIHSGEAVFEIPRCSEFSWALLRFKIFTAPSIFGGGKLHFNLRLKSLYNQFAS